MLKTVPVSLFTFNPLFRGQIFIIGPGTGSPCGTFSRMDRFFLALMVSGLLLAAAAVSLLVASSGSESTVSLTTIPAAPVKPTPKVTPHHAQENRSAPQDGTR